MKVMVHDPFIDKKIIVSNKCIPIDKIEGYKKADFISIHLPLNKDTKNFISIMNLICLKKSNFN